MADTIGVASTLGMTQLDDFLLDDHRLVLASLAIKLRGTKTEQLPQVCNKIQFIDLIIAIAGLVLLAPLMVMIGLSIALWDRGPVFYRHQRIGQRGMLFDCLKFRTMHIDAAQRLADFLASNPAERAEWNATHKLRNDPRLTSIGALLRKTSLDELPQLFNVLSGTMSVVGPRPIIASEARRYGRYLWEYTRVRPGITGLWQISGRSDTTYRRRVACDVIYVRSKSLASDLRIVAMTVPAVVLGRGAY